MLGNIKKQTNVQVWIDDKTYDEFIERLKKVEKYAAENKLGVWSDK